MKKLIRILIICSFLISLSGISALAAPTDPPRVFLPFFQRSATTYTVTGTITDVDHFPVSNAVVRDAAGKSTVTDLNGQYTLALPTGSNTLTATRGGFKIAPLVINVNGPMVAQNMTALAGCGDEMVNGAVTTDLGGWDFPVADSSGGHTTGGTDAAQFISAPTSGRTGILAGGGLDTVVSDSTGVSQVYNIPSDADIALLGLWIYQVSTSVGTPGDQQYIQILDKNDNVLDIKLSQNVNNPVWTYVEFNLNNRIGEAIKVEVGTFNNGSGGVAAMYFDDVTLTLCTTELGSGGCANVILNGTMEATGGWSFYTPETVPPAYTGTFFHNGAFSMQTGIPVGGVETISFSEVFQIFNIPSNAKDTHLSFWFYTTSSVTAANIPTFRPEELNALHRSYTPAVDQQYAYLNPGESDQAVLFKFDADNFGAWDHFDSDDPDWNVELNDYIGKNVTLLFGTYNDAAAGVSAMYIDDVALEYCVAINAPVPDSPLPVVDAE